MGSSDDDRDDEIEMVEAQIAKQQAQLEAEDKKLQEQRLQALKERGGRPVTSELFNLPKGSETLG